MGNHSHENLDQTILSLVEAGNFPQAIALLRKRIYEEPNNSKMLLRLAYCLDQVGETEEARQCLERITEIDPANTRAAQMLQNLQKTGTTQTQARYEQSTQFEMIGGNDNLKPQFRYKHCSNCGEKILSSSNRCPICGQWFWARILTNIALFAVIVLGGSYALRYAVVGPDRPPAVQNQEAQAPSPLYQPRGPSQGILTDFTPGIVFLFFLRYSITVGALLGACFLLNALDKHKPWNHEWKSDVLASVVLIFAFALMNILMYMIGNAPVAPQVRMGLSPAISLVSLGLLIVQLVLFFVLFKRGILETIGLILLFFCFKTLLEDFIYSPIVTLLF